jgi:hypothetical protein
MALAAVTDELLDDAFHLTVGAGVWGDGDESEVWARAHPPFKGLDDEILAVSLARSLGAKIHAEAGELAAGYVPGHPFADVVQVAEEVLSGLRTRKQGSGDQNARECDRRWALERRRSRVIDHPSVKSKI